MNNGFDRDSFAEVIGSSFKLRSENGIMADLTLIEVSELRTRFPLTSFSTIFLAPESYRLEQGLYYLGHEKLGDMQLFLVPVGAENGQLQLEAVFNFLQADRSKPSE